MRTPTASASSPTTEGPARPIRALALAVGGGEVEIVQRVKRGHPEVPHRLHEVEPGADIQVIGWFVEDEHPPLPGQCPGEQDPLFLAAGERGVLPPGRVPQARRP